MPLHLGDYSVKKGEILQRPGEFNSKVFYVKQGLLRSYTIDNKGKEHIFMFAPEGWTIGDSIPPDEATELYIDALEDSEIVVAEKDLSSENHNMRALFRRIAVLQKRIIMLISAPAFERYEHFVKAYPDIIQRVPQKMIASYLGITPEALSKLKGEMARKK